MSTTPRYSTSRIVNRLKVLEPSSLASGFTLIELAVAVVVIAALVTLALPTFLTQRHRAADRVAVTDLVSAGKQASDFYLEHNSNFLTQPPPTQLLDDWVAGTLFEAVTEHVACLETTSTTGRVFTLVLIQQPVPTANNSIPAGRWLGVGPRSIWCDAANPSSSLTTIEESIVVEDDPVDSPPEFPLTPVEHPPLQTSPDTSDPGSPGTGGDPGTWEPTGSDCGPLSPDFGEDVTVQCWLSPAQSGFETGPSIHDPGYIDAGWPGAWISQNVEGFWFVPTTENVHAGTYSVQLANGGSVSAGMYVGDPYAYPYLPSGNEGDTFYFYGWYSNDTVPGVGLFVELVAYDTNGDTLEELRFPLPVTSGYEYFEYSYTLDADGAVRFALASVQGEWDGVARFDNWQLAQVFGPNSPGPGGGGGAEGPEARMCEYTPGTNIVPNPGFDIEETNTLVTTTTYYHLDGTPLSFSEWWTVKEGEEWSPERFQWAAEVTPHTDNFLTVWDTNNFTFASVLCEFDNYLVPVSALVEPGDQVELTFDAAKRHWSGPLLGTNVEMRYIFHDANGEVVGSGPTPYEVITVFPTHDYWDTFTLTTPAAPAGAAYVTFSLNNAADWPQFWLDDVSIIVNP